MDVFIYTAKVNRKRIRLAAAGLLCLCVAAAAVWLGAGWRSAAAEADPKGVKTAEDRAGYLASWGWQVPADAAGVEELELPKEFGPEYDQYLALQSGQGFDLTKYAGKRIKRYTYEVSNYPGGQTGVQAHLLMYKNTVIGGEVLGEGFLHGLAFPG